MQVVHKDEEHGESDVVEDLDGGDAYQPLVSCVLEVLLELLFKWRPHGLYYFIYFVNYYSNSSIYEKKLRQERL